MSDSEYNFWDDLMGSDEAAGEYMISYDEGPGADTRTFLSAFINDGESVLDAGCGPGHNYEHFLTHGPDVTYRGLDYAIRFVRANRVKYPGADFRKGDIRHLEEADNSWDVVIMQDCIEHTNGYELPIREALRVARKRAIFTFWHLVDSDTPHINDDGNDGWGAWYDKREVEQFLDSLGYPVIDTELEVEGKTHTWMFYVVDKGLV